MTLIFILKIRKKLLFIKVKLQQYLNLFQLHFTLQLHFLRKEVTFVFFILKVESVVLNIFPTKREALLQLHFM